MIQVWVYENIRREILEYLSILEDSIGFLKEKSSIYVREAINEFVTDAFCLYLMVKIEKLQINEILYFFLDETESSNNHFRSLTSLLDINVDNIKYLKSSLDSNRNPLFLFPDNEELKVTNLLEKNMYVPIFDFFNHLEKKYIEMDGYLLSFLYEVVLNRKIRKSQGSYFTPKKIASFMFKQALKLFFEEKINININNLDENISSIQLLDIINILETVTVLDPSIGTGHFIEPIIFVLIDVFLELQHLIKSNHNHLSIVIKKKEYYNLEQSEFRYYVVVKIIIPNIIYGVDLDANAIKIVKLRLILLVNNLKDSNIDQIFKIISKSNLKVGDSLIGNILESNELIFDKIKKIVPLYFDWYKNFKNFKGFDIVIGNPPFVNSKEIPKEYKKMIKNLSILGSSKETPNYYSLNRGQFDLYTLFIERSYKLLKNKGILNLIIPDSIIDRSNFKIVRNFLINNLKIYSIISAKNLFNDPNISNILILGSKKQEIEDYEIGFASIDFKLTKTIESLPLKFSNVSQIKILPNLSLKYYLPIETSIISFLLNYNQLENLIEIGRGEEMGKNLLNNERKNKNNYQKIISGSHIKRYSIDSPYYIDSNLIIKKDLLYKSPKIFVRQLGESINSVMDYSENLVSLQTVYNIHLKNKEIPLHYIVAILNSKLMTWLVKKLFRGKELFSRILIENINSIPLARSKNFSPFIYIVNLLHIINNTNTDQSSYLTTSKFLDKEILDNLVFETYFNNKFKKKKLLNAIIQLLNELDGIETIKPYDLHVPEFYDNFVSKIKGLMIDKEFLSIIENIKKDNWVSFIQGN